MLYCTTLCTVNSDWLLHLCIHTYTYIYNYLLKEKQKKMEKTLTSTDLIKNVPLI